MWHLLAGLMSGNAVWFLVYVVATLLRFNMTSNAYKSGQAPLIGKNTGQPILLKGQSLNVHTHV